MTIITFIPLLRTAVSKFPSVLGARSASKMFVNYVRIPYSKGYVKVRRSGWSVSVSIRMREGW